MSEIERRWWKEAVVYQIYPRSFMDSNGDGIGDIPGIVSKLDYLKDLGVDILWLSPIFKSPNDDNGYDISDYQDIMDEFGCMADFDAMLKEVHKRGMKLIMDLVVNHTSDEHPWFVESRSSKDSPKRDWYHWQAPVNGGVPNNWGSVFGGPAWELDEKTGEYYLHIFSRKQCDLNWDNQDMRQAVYEMMRWWCDKGIDGWRMDVANWYVKPKGFVDAPIPADHKHPYIFSSSHMLNNPGIHEILHEMNREVFSKYDIMTVGEIHEVNARTGVPYADQSHRELDMLFQFDVMWTDGDLPRRKRLVNDWYTEGKGKAWNTMTLNNHDTRRLVSRFGNDKLYRMESAKCLATFLLCSPGTPYLLQGEELGMTDVVFPSIDDYNDVHMKTTYRFLVENGEDPKMLLEKMRVTCRDNARTPVQWDDSHNAGFTTGTPWIKVNPNYKDINAKAEMVDPNSVYHYYRNLIKLRKENLALIYGDYQPLCIDDPAIDAFVREINDESALVILNCSSEEQVFDLPDTVSGKQWVVQLGNYADSPEDASSSVKLRPWEALIFQGA